MQRCTLQEFEPFGALYMHNHDDKYPARPGFEGGAFGEWKWLFAR